MKQHAYHKSQEPPNIRHGPIASPTNVNESGYSEEHTCGTVHPKSPQSGIGGISIATLISDPEVSVSLSEPLSMPCEGVASSGSDCGSGQFHDVAWATMYMQECYHTTSQNP